MSESWRTRLPELLMPPPLSTAALSVTRQASRVRLPWLRMPPPLSSLPWLRVIARRVTAWPGPTSSTRNASPAERVSPEARFEASRTRGFSIASGALVRVMVPPSRVSEKLMVVPAAALAMVSRSEPGPESAWVVTWAGGVWISTAPMSIAPPTTRAKPRWSVANVVVPPASIAGEAASGGMLKVGPP